MAASFTLFICWEILFFLFHGERRNKPQPVSSIQRPEAMGPLSFPPHRPGSLHLCRCKLGRQCEPAGLGEETISLPGSNGWTETWQGAELRKRGGREWALQRLGWLWRKILSKYLEPRLNRGAPATPSCPGCSFLIPAPPPLPNQPSPHPPMSQGQNPGPSLSSCWADTGPPHQLKSNTKPMDTSILATPLRSPRASAWSSNKAEPLLYPDRLRAHNVG